MFTSSNPDQNLILRVWIRISRPSKKSKTHVQSPHLNAPTGLTLNPDQPISKHFIIAHVSTAIISEVVCTANQTSFCSAEQCRDECYIKDITDLTCRFRPSIKTHRHCHTVTLNSYRLTREAMTKRLRKS